MAFDPQEVSAPGAKIKVIGVGGGGTNAVSTMIRSNIEGVEFIAANTDVQSLRFALAPTKIQIGKDLTKGLGAGADPDIGRDAALEDRHELHEAIAGADMVFVTAGMGGGTGTGGAAIISQIARENGALTVGVVTKPFSFEGKRRRKHAEHGIQKLKEHVDTLVVIPNDRLLKIATPDLSMLDAFRMADTVLVNAVRGISDIINVPGTINVDFADVKTVMSSMGQALMGIGHARGENRAQEAARQAISSPLLEDVDIEGATGILINITASSNLSLMEINEACSIIEKAAHEDANIIFGAVIDENMKEDIRITVIATGFPSADDDDYLVAPAPRSHPLVSPTYRSTGARPAATAARSYSFHQEREESFNALLNEKSQRRAGEAKTPAQPLASPKSAPKEGPKEASAAEKVAASQAPLSKASFAELDENDLAHWTIAQVEHTPEVDDSITKEAPKLDPKIDFQPSSPQFAATPLPSEQQSAFIAPEERPVASTAPTPMASSKEQDLKEANDLTESFLQKVEMSSIEKLQTTSWKSRSDLEADDDFFLSDHRSLSDDIDKRIDEALELAEKVRSLDRKDDDLDVPAYLRNHNKDITL